MTGPTPADLLAVAVEAGRAAGRHAVDQRHRRRETLVVSDHDVKLRLDVECQEVAEVVIRSAYPDHDFFGEEGGELRADPDTIQWVVDPIDGTVNFSHGLPLWGNSVAAMWGGETVAGAIALPDLGETYTATTDQPALCNGEPIRASEATRLADAILTCGLSGKLDSEGDEILGDYARMVRKAQKVRQLGSAAVMLAYVACGRVEAYYEPRIHLWDIAAGNLIAARAGARFEIFRHFGPVTMQYLCAAPGVFGALRELVTGAGA